MRAGDLVIGIPSGILTVWFKREICFSFRFLFTKLAASVVPSSVGSITSPWGVGWHILVHLECLMKRILL